MKKSITFCSAALLATSVSADPFLDWAQDGLDSGERVGGVIAIIDGDSVAYRPFGVKSAGSDEPIAEATRFEIGSITKVFTNLLLAEMVAAGKASYEMTLGDALPAVDFVNPEVGTITLEELATHTSGLPRLPANLQPANPANPYAEYDADALIESLRTTRSEGRLTKRYAYSNLGVGALGYILGVIDGRGYAAALKAHVLDRLRPNTLTVGCNANDAAGHVGQAVTSHWDLASLSGAGALCGAAPDLVRLIQVYLNHEEAFLHDESAGLEIVHDSPMVALTRIWHTALSENGVVYWHNGGTGGFSSFAGFNPTTEQGLVVLANSNADVTAFAMDVLGAKPPEREAAAETDALPLEDYVGHFALTPTFGISVMRRGETLYAQATSQPPLTLEPTGEDRFSILEVDAEISFRRDSAGAVDQLTLHQNGQNMPGDRVAEPIKAKSFDVIDIDRDELDRYVGEYELVPGVRFTILRDGGQLTAQLTGQPALPVYPHAEHRFHYRAVDAQLTFHLDGGDDAATALTLHQNGMDQRAGRVKE